MDLVYTVNKPPAVESSFCAGAWIGYLHARLTRLVRLRPNTFNGIGCGVLGYDHATSLGKYAADQPGPSEHPPLLGQYLLLAAVVINTR